MSSNNPGRVLAVCVLCLALVAGCQSSEETLAPAPAVELTKRDNILMPRALQNDGARPAWHRGRVAVQSGAQVFALDRSGHDLVVADAALSEVVRRVALGGQPAQLAIGPDGAAWITLRSTGELVRVDEGASTPTARIAVGPGATGLALSTEGDTVFVASTLNNEVLAVDAASHAIVAHAVVARPRAIVSHAEGRLTVTSERPEVTGLVFDALKGALTPENRWPLRRHNPLIKDHPKPHELQKQAAVAFSAALHPETGQVLVAHQLAASQPPEFSVLGASGSAGYGNVKPEDSEDPVLPDDPELPTPPETPGDTPIEVTATLVGPDADLPAVKPVATHLRAQFNMPTDIAHHTTHALAFIACNGSDNVLVVNTAVQDPMSVPLGQIEVGHGPVALTVSEDGRWLFVLQDYGHSLVRIDLAPMFQIFDAWRTDMALPFTLAADTDDALVVGVDPLSDRAKLGRRIFSHSGYPGLSAKASFACQNCHPEGREDGLIWTIETGPRQTPSLAGRLAGTAPFNWIGSESSLHDNFLDTIDRMGGGAMDAVELDALEAFILEGLQAEPTPHLGPDGLTAAQLRGKALYEDAEVGCASCHGGEALTDGLSHNVGTVSDQERRLVSTGAIDRADLGRYDTPSLKGLFRTAPYFHDGSARTLMEVLDQTARTMGRTDHLTEDQKHDLIDYLRTL